MDESHQRLARQGVLSWSVLAVGLDRGWTDPASVAEAAQDWLSQHPGQEPSSVLLLAGGEGEEPDVVKSWLSEATEELGSESEETCLDLWRWAKLTTLDEAAVRAEAKLERLQELYADFGYPEDMAACSIYHVEPGATKPGETGKDPLVAMKEVIATLAGRLLARS